jgi:TfoX/Sxy family transcriptional regulator of competence genes
MPSGAKRRKPMNKRPSHNRAGSGSASNGEAAFEPIVNAFRGDAKVTTAKMFGSPGLKVNGKVFAMVVKGKPVVKLPKGRVDDLVSSGSGEYFNPGHGKLMKEWIAVTGTKPSWVDLSREAYCFVKGGK